MNSPEANDEVAALTEAVLGQQGSPEQNRQFAERLRDDPKARQAYAEQARLHALLQWRSGPAVDVAKSTSVPVTETSVVGQRSVFPFWLAAAALVFLSLGGFWLSRPSVFTITVAENLTPQESARWQSGQVRGRETIALTQGHLQLLTTTGVRVDVVGPATLELHDAMLVKVATGRVTAEVPEAAHGFAIETAQARIVDLGTQFGVAADEHGATSVVVFKGSVEVATAQQPAPRRLHQGEALRLTDDQPAERIPNVYTNTRPAEWSADRTTGIVRQVRDNLRALDSANFYEIVPHGLVEDARAYVDRDHEWNGTSPAGLPDFLIGADLVRPFNDDKRATDLRITVELAGPATLYLFVDRRAPPAWLRDSGFVETDAQVGLDEGPSLHRQEQTDRGPARSIERVFSVWKREFQAAASVELGPPREGPIGAKAMYGIAAQPLVTP